MKIPYWLRLLYCCVPILLLPAGTSTAQDISTLKKGFQHPPATARPMVFWHWMNGNISKDGIRKDLLDMQRCGISGVILFNVAQDVPAGPIRYGSPAWYDHVLYAIRLCDSLHLTFINTNCPGWSTSGGPWVDVEHSMKVITWSEQEVKGGSCQQVQLPMPATKLNYYKEIGVVAVPSDKDRILPLSEIATLTYADTASSLQMDKLTDGNDETGVSIPISDAKEYVQLSFKQPVTASLLTVKLGTGAWLYTFAGRIAYTTDGKTYQPLRDFHYYGRIANNAITIPFETVKAVGFRLYCKSAYRSITLATDIRELELSACRRLDNAEAQIGRSFSYIDRSNDRRKPDGALADTVIDLTAQMNANGLLTWEVPPGNWTIIRMGYTSSGTTNHPAPPESTGLEVDKFDSSAVVWHFEQMHNPLLKLAAANDIHSWKGVAIDSWEAGLQNWSHHFLQDFQRLHGYDLKKYLPVLTGRIMGDASTSAAVLWDYRNTISTLMAKRFYGATREAARRHGLQLYAEPYGGYYDAHRNAQYPDMVLGEFWMYFGENNIKRMSSAVHTSGKTIVGAEAFTAVPQYGAYQDMPAYLKAVGDKAFTDGLNLNILHSYVHQPADSAPGFTLGRFGSHFGRLNTWWRHAPAWIDYLSRTQYLLQQGHMVADISVIKNDDADYSYPEPNVDTLRKQWKGYDFDFVSSDDVLRMKAKGGKVYLPDGQSYSVLVWPFNGRIQLPVLRHILKLVKQGAHIEGPPLFAPSGVVSKKEQSLFKELITQIWMIATQYKGPGPPGRTSYASLRKLPAILQSRHILPDVEIIGADSLLYIHRQTDVADIYFFSHQENSTRHVMVTLRTVGRPQLWDPVSGKISDVKSYVVAGGRTSVLLPMPPYCATFVMIARDTTLMKGTVGSIEALFKTLPTPVPHYTLPLHGPWELAFADGQGAPAPIQLDTLQLWNTFANTRIRYYSGTGVYRQSFTLPDTQPAYKTCALKLEGLYDIAGVSVNGKQAGVIWTAPYTLDITPYLHKGNNVIELQVTNRWINRLIGDERDSTLPRKTFTTYRHYNAQSALVPSGVAGPVTLLFY